MAKSKSHSSLQILLPCSTSRICCSLAIAQGPVHETCCRSANTRCDQMLWDPAKCRSRYAIFPLKQAGANVLKTKPGSPGFAQEKAVLEDARRQTIADVHKTEMSPLGLFWAHALWWLMPDTFNAKFLFTGSCFLQCSLSLSARHARGVRWLCPSRQLRIKQWSQSTEENASALKKKPTFAWSLELAWSPKSCIQSVSSSLGVSAFLRSFSDLQCYCWDKVNSYLMQTDIFWQGGIWAAKFGLVRKQNISTVALNFVQGSQGYNGTRRMVDLHAPSFLSVKSFVILMQISDPWQYGLEHGLLRSVQVL